MFVKRIVTIFLKALLIVLLFLGFIRIFGVTPSELVFGIGEGVRYLMPKSPERILVEVPKIEYVEKEDCPVCPKCPQETAEVLRERRMIVEAMRIAGIEQKLLSECEAVMRRSGGKVYAPCVREVGQYLLLQRKTTQCPTAQAKPIQDLGELMNGDVVLFNGMKFCVSSIQTQNFVKSTIKDDPPVLIHLRPNGDCLVGQ